MGLSEHGENGTGPLDPKTALRKVIEGIAGCEVPHRLLDELARELRPRRLERGALLIHRGDAVSQVALVCSGLLRIYYPRPDGKEFIKSFVWAPDFVAAFESLLTGEPSPVAVECLEDAMLCELDYGLVRGLQERDPFWQRFGRLLAERLYVKKARREAALLLDSASQRYETFLATHGPVAERIPGYHVAAYLGITPEALSRIRRRRVAR